MSKIKFAKLPKIKYVVEVTIATCFNKTMGHTSSSARVLINRDYDNIQLFQIQPGTEYLMRSNIRKFLAEQGILQADRFTQLDHGIVYNEHTIQTTRRNCTDLGKGRYTHFSNV